MKEMRMGGPARYAGTRTTKGDTIVVKVLADGRTRGVNPRYDLCNHSPNGYEYGAN